MHFACMITPDQKSAPRSSGCAASFLLRDHHDVSPRRPRSMQIVLYLHCKVCFIYFHCLLLDLRSFLHIRRPQEPWIAYIFPTTTRVSSRTRQKHTTTSPTIVLETPTLDDANYAHRHPPGAMKPTQIRNPTAPVASTSTLGPIASAHKFHTLRECTIRLGI